MNSSKSVHPPVFLVCMSLAAVSTVTSTVGSNGRSTTGTLVSSASMRGRLDLRDFVTDGEDDASTFR